MTPMKEAEDLTNGQESGDLGPNDETSRAADSVTKFVTPLPFHDGDGGTCMTGASGMLEYVPSENKIDAQYWKKRSKNGEASRRSRKNRGTHGLTLENRVNELSEENDQLKTELITIKRKFGLPLGETVSSGPNDTPVRNDQNPGPRQQNAGNQSLAPSQSSSAVSANSQLGQPTPQQLLAVARTVPIPIAMPPIVALGGQDPGVPVFMSPLYNSTISTHPHVTKAAAPTTLTSGEKYVASSPAANGHGTLRSTSKSSSPSTQYDPSQVSANIFQVSPEQKSAEGINLGQVTLLAMLRRSCIGSSNDSMDSSDSEGSPRPLELTLKRDVDSQSSPNPSAGNMDYPAGENPISKVRYSTMALSHELRYKIPSLDPVIQGSSLPNFSHSTNGLALLSEIALAHASPLSLAKPGICSSIEAAGYFDRRGENEGDSDHTDPTLMGPKYRERRRRNREAARKCRENRKASSRVREDKTTILETENRELRTKICSVRSEIKRLKELLENDDYTETAT